MTRERRQSVEVGKRGKTIKIGGVWYEVGQFLMITDTTIRFQIPAKVAKVYPKKTVDPKMYPEHWRKPEQYEGDHADTWEPFQIVRLEEVVNNGRGCFIRVRKMYRPHDTHLSHEEARTRPLTELFWSGEVARMYPKDVANRTNKVSMEDIVGPCHVRSLENHNSEDDLIKWSDEGEDRFFIGKSYDADSKSFMPVSGDIIEAMNTVLTKHPAPSLDTVTPLNTLDIFAGCGGLSHGLGQSGVAAHKWAIEFWKPSADASGAE